MLDPLLSETTDFDPPYYIVVLRFVYEFIIDSRTHFGSPRPSRPASTGL